MKLVPFHPDCTSRFSQSNPVALTITILIAMLPIKLSASSRDDAKTVSELDTQYQAAVEANDTATMDHILADDFALVTGRGQVSSKADLLKQAREKQTIYEHQDEEAGSQKVRVWGDTAVVTALLWIKGVQEGKPVDFKLWFSDTYCQTRQGWRYVFGQASLPLPKPDVH